MQLVIYIYIHRNFLPFTRTADFPHRPIIAYGGEKKKSTDYPHWWITCTLWKPRRDHDQLSPVGYGGEP